MNISNNLTLTTSNPQYWERCYQSGEMGWDLGEATPIFDNWIENYRTALNICVLGAGNGWDAINFAQRGHAVTAVDFAESAVKNMQDTAKQNNLEIDIRHMNIFDLKEIYTNYFDVVLEYTCFCAINPSKRRDYLDMARHILKSQGELVGLLFPIDKAPEDGGPPFAVQLEPTIKLISEYFFLIKREIPSLSIKPRLGREVFVIFRKDGKKIKTNNI